MLTILTPQQMNRLEQHAFSLGVPSLLVMENAAREAFLVVEEVLKGVKGKNLLFLIGTGNNGGDGLAMARLCQQKGGKPCIIQLDEAKTPDARTNNAYVQALGIPVLNKEEMEEHSFDAVIDALFGTGFHGQLPQSAASLLETVNQWGITRIAIDVPSGLDSETGQQSRDTFCADFTIVLGHLKTGHCITKDKNRIGKVSLVPIGLPKQAYSVLASECLLTALEEEDLKASLPRRAANAHKGDNGRVLMYMGSLGMAGAAGMAAQAALASLRAGAGLLTIACEKEIIPILQTLAPNAMCIPIEEAVKNRPRYDVFAVGCGLGQSKGVWDNILALWSPELPSVWDADALNLLAKNPINLGNYAVITPHPGEAARLMNMSVDELTHSPLNAAKQLQTTYGGVVLLKGDVSLIQSAHETAFNLVGSPALAKGGSGDALAGIIASLIAQEPKRGLFHAVQTACLWHGMAGESAAAQLGLLSPLTTDVIEHLGVVSAFTAE